MGRFGFLAAFFAGFFLLGFFLAGFFAAFFFAGFFFVGLLAFFLAARPKLTWAAEGGWRGATVGANRKVDRPSSI